jgi:NADH dehydrogenase
MKKQLMIIGGGFAGFWSALSAIRQSRELQKAGELEITLVNTDNYFTIRPRLYEVSLEGLRVELDKYLKPLGIQQVMGKAELIDPEKQEVTVSTVHGVRSLKYDYLILATGGALKAINLPGIEFTQNVDTFEGAQRLEDHLVTLAKKDFAEEGAATLVVAGAGFTGLEAVTSIADKARMIAGKYAGKQPELKVVLIDRGAKLGGFFDEEGQEYIAKACAEKNIEVINGAEIQSITPAGIVLNNGQALATRTVIWTVGMVASALTAFFKGEKDNQGRLMVDTFLKLRTYDNVIIAGDVAHVSVDNGHTAVMACQYAQFMGRWAGHNAVNDLFATPLKEYIQNGYVTCLDLGESHALYTSGWERKVHQSGEEARATKSWVNTILLYPQQDVEEAVTASYPEIPQF